MKRFAKERDLLLLVIDAETGYAREYLWALIDRADNVVSGRTSRLYVARIRGYDNVYAVIFDPRIEEFLEEFSGLRVKEYESIIKSRKACRYLRATLDEMGNVLSEVAARLCRLISRTETN